MADKVLAMAHVAPGEMELREFDLPEVPTDAALLRVEAAGVCGSDVTSFARAPKAPEVMGHENVGTVIAIGDLARDRWRLTEGDVVALEEYLPCYYCEWCHIGEYRHCAATDMLNHGERADRYGHTSVEKFPGLWGGFGQYLFMAHNAVWHRVPENVSPHEASLHIALGNGVQWACIDGGVGPGKSVVIQGPGQMGTAATIASKSAGASLIVVSGRSSDASRLEACKQLGADVVVDIDREDLRDTVRSLTGGRGVDVVVDTTSGRGYEPLFVGVDLLKRRGGTIVVQGAYADPIPEFPLATFAAKFITMKLARGHSYAAVQRGLEIMAEHRFDLSLMHTHDFPLSQADRAIRATEGELVDGRRALHVAVLPWS